MQGVTLAFGNVALAYGTVHMALMIKAVRVELPLFPNCCRLLKDDVVELLLLCPTISMVLEKLTFLDASVSWSTSFLHHGANVLAADILQ